ncbi:MAG: bifunctional folylpolyglutamate synthase/dihydrofolate synthase [Magnetococcales bacterium]|nr:bifunctional folylpolyglutamate synthase/dihydrofolate synthase [Magnetococcales bacterium]MBF0115922.1 bifunctional folylpolyglutamate synthase/dihydrofolate synthase [Magnetococcales bacterium]
MEASLEELLQHISRQTPLPVQLGLQRVTALLDALGQPQKNLPIIHVAGTNGKGSVLAFLEAVLLEAGFRVGMYTSPHLQCLNERFRWQGQAVDDATLSRLLAMLLQRFPEHRATFFEWLTVLAFVLFHTQGAAEQDAGHPAIVLLETGLGGRLDATNVVEPILTLLTRIDWDHTDYLGTSLAAIAREKAGIFKKGVLACTVRQTEEVQEVLAQEARRVGLYLRVQGQDFDHSRVVSSGEWLFRDGWPVLHLPAPGLPGLHQYDNAAVAVAALRHLQRQQWPIADQDMQRGIAKAHWPARLERFCLPDHPALTILLDGAHNPSGCQVLAEYLAVVPGRVTFLFAALRDKPIAAMVALLAPHAERVFTVAVGGERALSAPELALFWQEHACPATPCADPEEALQQALAATPVGYIVVCGSLYLAGQIRGCLLRCMGK